MKKLLVIAVCCLCLCGCSKDAGYEVSELIPNSYLELSYIKGTLKNVSNETCDQVQINVTLSSGTINEDGWIWVESPKPGKSISFNNVLYGGSNTKNIEDYNVKLKNIECWLEKETS